MATQIVYTNRQIDFDELMDRVINDAEIVIVERQGRGSVAMITRHELERMQETLYLLNSPENAKRIQLGIEEGQQSRIQSQTAQEIRTEFGLNE